jgi:hypothetical protein
MDRRPRGVVNRRKAGPVYNARRARDQRLANHSVDRLVIKPSKRDRIIHWDYFILV